jgi:hypothetical protein
MECFFFLFIGPKGSDPSGNSNAIVLFIDQEGFKIIWHSFFITAANSLREMLIRSGKNVWHFVFHQCFPVQSFGTAFFLFVAAISLRE